MLHFADNSPVLGDSEIQGNSNYSRFDDSILYKFLKYNINQRFDICLNVESQTKIQIHRCLIFTGFMNVP